MVDKHRLVIQTGAEEELSNVQHSNRPVFVERPLQMSTPLLVSKHDSLAAHLPDSFTELWGACESSSAVVPAPLRQGTAVPRVRDSQRPNNSRTQFGDRGRVRMASGAAVAGGFASGCTRGEVGFRTTPRVAVWAIGLGIALGTLSGLVYLDGEAPADYVAPSMVAAETR